LTEQFAALELEYDGGPFCGWSRQPGRASVEQSLFDAFAAVGASVLRLRCAGRTDAGVHADAQVVSVAYRGGPPPPRLAKALGTQLPAEVSVRRSAECHPTFDARALARTRAYEYRVLTSSVRSPLRRRHVLHHPGRLDEDLLARAAAVLQGKHDFSPFTPTETTHVFFHRTLLESRWERRADELVYHVRANAFMRNMVRVIVGTMLEVGRGRRSLDSLAALLEGGAGRSQAGPTAPAHALRLVDVTYDEPPFR
jgi:tRNA pseudouridine38-40 synthase